MNTNQGQETPGPQIMSPLAKYKLVFLGDQSVGKTSIINRFIFDVFDGKNHPTVGIDFISKTLHFDERTVRLQLWDTAGQERFRSLIPNYIRDSSVAVIVYDITNVTSFQSVQRWYEDVKNQRGNDVIIILVGNKTDLEDQRQVSTEEIEKKSKELDVQFIEVSAQSGMNVDNLFKNIANMLPNNEMSQMLSATQNMIMNPYAFNSQRNESAVPQPPNKILLQNQATNVQSEKKESKETSCC